MAPLRSFLVALALATPATSLSANSPPPTKPKPVRRVAVVGAGISGLGVAHALHSLSAREDEFELSLFDARGALNPRDGAGIQLNGGLAALGMIDGGLQRAVMDAGIPQVGVRSRAKAWDSKKGPKSTNFDTLLELDIQELVRNAGGETTAGLVQEDDAVLWYSIMRGALQEALLERLPPKISNNLQFGKKLLDIVEADTQEGVFCRFEDDTMYGPFDLVIGCDGVKSAVKEYMGSGKIEKGKNIGIYSGIRIKFAVMDGDLKEENPTKATLTQYFGDGGYALDGTYGNGKDKAPTKCGFLVYLDPGYIGPFKKKENNAKKVDENVDWAQDNRQRVEDGRKNMLDQIQAADIPDFELAPTISNADRFFELGVYFHNPFNRWSKDIANGAATAVLVGDAAHAMPPFLGQGANQALQDAYTLCAKICEYNAVARGEVVLAEDEEEESVSLKRYLNEYEQTRWFATFSITLKSTFLGYLETGGFEGYYAKFRDVFFRAMGLIGVARKVLLDAATPKL